MLTLWIIKKGLKLGIWLCIRTIMIACFIPVFLCKCLAVVAESLIESK